MKILRELRALMLAAVICFSIAAEATGRWLTPPDPPSPPALATIPPAFGGEPEERILLPLKPCAVYGLDDTARCGTLADFFAAGTADRLDTACLETIRRPPFFVPPLAGESSQGSDTVIVLPGDSRLDVNRVVPHRATWRVTIHDTDDSSTVQGLWTDTWVRSEEDGRPVMEFRTLFVDTQGKVLVDNETVFDATSFRALRSTKHMLPSGARVSYRFDGDTVSGTLQPSAGAEPRQFEVVFNEPVWEPLTPVRWLLPFEGLEPGTVIRYPIWDQTSSGDDVTWSTLRIGSIRSIRAPDGSTAEALSHTMTTDAAPGVVFRVLRMLEPPYVGWWLRVERPGLTREWTLVDWELYAPVPARPESETSPVSED